MAPGLRISNAEDLKALYKVLSTSLSVETCATSLNHDIPAKMMRSFSIAPHIRPEDVSNPNANTILAVVLSTLANHQDFEELEVASPWINSMDMVPAARWSWRLKVSQWDNLLLEEDWPAIHSKPLSHVDDLIFSMPVQADHISWTSFAGLANVSLLADDVCALEFIMSRISDIRSSNRNFRRITLLSSHAYRPRAVDVKDCKNHGIDLVTQIASSS